MSDFFTAAIHWQREILRAQQAQLDAAQAMIDAAGRAVDLQKAGQQALDANARASAAWLKLWGWK